MKQYCLALLLLLSLNQTWAATPKASVKPPARTSLEAITATRALITNQLIKGHVYQLHQAPGLTVEQSTEDGVLVRFSNGYSPFGEIPSILHLKTARQYADNSFVSSSLCVSYTGLYRYINVMGANRTIHSFNEVPCKNYALPQAWVEQDKARLMAYAQERIQQVSNEYLQQTLPSILQNWQTPPLELKSPEQPTIITAVVSPDGQIYNAKIEASSEPVNTVLNQPIQTDKQAYQQQLNAYYHQNHLLADNNALHALAASHIPPFPQGWTMPGLNVRFIFNPYKKRLQAEYLSNFNGDIKALTKTIPAPIAIYYPQRPEPPLSPQAQAATQQAKFAQQQAYSQQKQAQTQNAIMSGVGILGGFIPLLH